jgi:quercetin dioxygenase-like cupin family protein
VKISHGRIESGPSRRAHTTFTGGVHQDTVLENRPAVAVNDVFFEPGGRTYWHSHANGQVLIVKAGQGFVGSRGDAAQAIRPGDVVYAEAGEEHWHGAGSDTFLLHTAISLGVTTWLEEVPEVPASE